MSEILEEVIEGYRLSPQQRRLWQWMCLVGPSAFRCSLRLELSGQIDPERLRAAWQQAVARHEAMRTSFRALPGLDLPLQVIGEDVDEQTKYTEIECGEAGCVAGACKSVEEEWNSLLRDHKGGSEWHVRAVRCGGKRWSVLVSTCGLSADVRTLRNLAAEWARCYEDGEAESLSEVVQYADFSEWQHELLESEEAKRAREQARTAAAQVRLPHEQAAQDASEYAPEEIKVDLNVELIARLRALAEECEAEVSDVIEAAWRVLLWRLSGEVEASLACSFDGRRIKHLQDAFGLFAKYLPVSCHLDANYQFSEIARQVRDAKVATAAQQDYLTAEDFSAEANNSAPVFLPFGFDYESFPANASGFLVSGVFSCTERFKLRLSVVEIDQTLQCALHYDPAFYATEVVQRWADSFVMLLQSGAKHPHLLIEGLEVIGQSERQRLLIEWNNTNTGYITDRCLHELFADQVERTPDAPAVVLGTTELSYRELNERANQVAHYLRRLGVGPEKLVCLCLDRSAQVIVALLGVLKAGGAYVPLDSEQPLPRLASIINDAGAHAVLTRQPLAERMPETISAQVVCIDSDEIAKERVDNPINHARPENLAYVIYTSGSTGLPKGVMVQHRSICNLLAALERAVYAHVPRQSRVSVNAPFSFDASVKQIIQLAAGHTLYLVPEEIRSDGKELLNWLRECGIKVFDSTPAQLRLLVDAGLGSGAENDLRAVLVGGEAISETLWTQLSSSKTSRYYNVYGPTECTVDAAVCRISGSEPNIGRPIANAQLYVLDRSGRLLPTGVIGELYIGGAGVGRGYLHSASLTAERFVPNPFSTESGARLYRTGDLARYLIGGEVEYAGRVDHQVKVRGYRVELGEIESALRAHTAVRDCVVITRDDESGFKRLIAYVVAAPQTNGHHAIIRSNGDAAKSMIDDLRRSLREQLPEYMMPSNILLLDELPLTRHGKVDRHSLPAPETSGLDGLERTAEVLPRTPFEELVASVWEGVLGVASIRREDNFFELGGHSLLATQVISRIRDVFQINIPLRSLFERPTVASFAIAVERAGQMDATVEGASEAPPLRPAPRDGELPLSFAQQRLWFIDQLEPGRPFYNGNMTIRLKGHLDLKSMSRTLNEVVRRHEVLRTTFTSVNGLPSQHIAPRLHLPLPIVDLSALDEPQRTLTARGLARKEAQLPFDLSVGPLLRVTLVRLSDEEHVALVSMHHIVSDAWSLDVLVREVATLYAAFSEGQPSPLEELPVQYADYAIWQRNYLQGEVLAQQLEYWRKQLTGAPATLELPMARPRPKVQTYRGAFYKLRFDAELTAALKALSLREGVTLFMTLLAAWKLMLARHTGQNDIVVGTAIANREWRETENLIGFFVNTLVLRTDLSGEPRFTELLKRVREVCLGAYAHQAVPFERLVEELRPERSLSTSPLFQVAFGLNNAPRMELQLPELRLDSVPVEQEEVRFDLTLWVVETGDGLHGRWTYRTELFDAEHIQQMTVHWETLLRSIVAAPDALLSSLEMYTEAEKAQRTSEGKARTESNYKKFLNVKPEAIRVSNV